MDRSPWEPQPSTDEWLNNASPEKADAPRAPHRTLGDVTEPRIGIPSTSSGRMRRATPPGQYARDRAPLLPHVREDTELRRAWRDVPEDEWDDEPWDDAGEWDEWENEPPLRGSGARLPARDERALAVVPRRQPLPDESAPALVAYRGRSRVATFTRGLRKRATHPWSLTRIVLIFVAIAAALVTNFGRSGELAQPLMGYSTDTGTGPAALWPVNAITAKVAAETQLIRSDLYDTQGQFNLYGGAACSAAALSEILTAYGVPGATIGHMIDELGGYISPSGGLLDFAGFSKVAESHGLRADMYVTHPLSQAQLKYFTNGLGVPVIVNVRISYGYYHFFAGGHFLVVTAVDDQGLRIVDSSLYYVKYLPWGVFNSMTTGRSVVIVPKAMAYTMP